MKFVCTAYPELNVYIPAEKRYVQFHQGSYETENLEEIAVLQKSANIFTPDMKQIAKAKVSAAGVMQLPPLVKPKAKPKPKPKPKPVVTVADLEKAGYGAEPQTAPEEAPHA